MSRWCRRRCVTELNYICGCIQSDVTELKWHGWGLTVVVDSWCNLPYKIGVIFGLAENLTSFVILVVQESFCPRSVCNPRVVKLYIIFVAYCVE